MQNLRLPLAITICFLVSIYNILAEDEKYLTDSSTAYAWNSNNWLPVGTDKYLYDSLGRLSGMTQYIFTGGQWSPRIKTTFSYNDKGSLMRRLSKYKNFEGIWKGYYEISNHYDSLGRKTDYFTWRFSESKDDWVMGEMHSFEYEPRGLLEYKFVEPYQVSDDMDFTIEYLYDDESRLVTASWCPATNNYLPVYRDIFTYDSSITVKTSLNSQNGSRIPKTKTITILNSAGLEAETLVLQSDSNAFWQLAMINSISYDSSGKETENLIQVLGKNPFSFRTLKTYDSNGNLISETEQYKLDSRWHNESKTDYGYKRFVKDTASGK